MKAVAAMPWAVGGTLGISGFRRDNKIICRKIAGNQAIWSPLGAGFFPMDVTIDPTVGAISSRSILGPIDNLLKRIVDQNGWGKDAALKHWDPNLDDHAHLAAPLRKPLSRAELESQRGISFRGWGLAAAVSAVCWAALIYAFISWL